MKATAWFRTTTRRTVACFLISAALTAVIAMPASARFRTRGFGPAIDETDYDGQEKCWPDPKPGVLAFRTMVLESFPMFGLGGISRACNVGGQSEHKEGRAWDMTANAGDPSHREAVQKLFDILLAEDRYGNEGALARRLGIMYIIWNRKIWGSWGGWSAYCVQKPSGCVDPEDRDIRHPHTDHVHFSFTWPGARMQTTYYNRDRSMMANLASHPSRGYWLVGANGSVNPVDAGWYGSKSDTFLSSPAIAMAPTLSGYGYLLVTQSGRVFAFGDARNRGFVKDAQVEIVDIEMAPTGNGYWLLARSGRVFAFGDAIDKLGDATESGASFAGMAATPTGAGYWLFASNGDVVAFGDAQDLGGLANEDVSSPVVGGDNQGATGYWLVTASGRVEALGSAEHYGDLRDKRLSGPVVGFATNPATDGYWLATAKGGVRSYGQAASLGSYRTATASSHTPELSALDH